MRLLGYQIVDSETNDVAPEFSSHDVITNIDTLNDFFQEFDEENTFVIKPVFDSQTELQYV